MRNKIILTLIGILICCKAFAVDYAKRFPTDTPLAVVTSATNTSAATGSSLTMNTGKLLGRTTAGVGAIQEISVGSGLTLSSGTLSASGSSGSPGGVVKNIQYNDGAGGFAGNANFNFSAADSVTGVDTVYIGDAGGSAVSGYNGGAGESGGGILVSSGEANNGAYINNGSLSITSSGATGGGADIYLTAGTGAGANSNGGKLFLASGDKTGAGSTGYIEFDQGNVGIGTSVNPSAKFEIISTTEQMRVRYDSSNYYKTTVASNGQVTFDAVGAGAEFVFSDNISAANLSGTNTGDQDLSGYFLLPVRNYVDATASNQTVTLPTASGITGQVYTVAKTDATTHTVTINTTGGQTINGDSSVIILIKDVSLDMVSDGSNWRIV